MKDTAGRPVACCVPPAAESGADRAYRVTVEPRVDVSVLLCVVLAYDALT